ncbi:ectoine/hydroxyectoine ABC transporter permease subunit EhuD [Brevibacillus brevis]|uniref:ectoine/hydroxyectoine ABC transporter permease subunit EhuD n=1 Tax=Brevibacillus brevis TaxID=1393 RepID=UPI000D0EBAB5|nr:ectoine/hydroxyectoine ABC transporter permease subunit EhuD [Brevibacillus brevis]PSJ68196.1 ectoine/hydroxyectoine ABC transporter permease subunit EhuD [Brevibacillus brevis]RED35693.1 amino acid ABC transporter membrane protein 2 (PAAT family) [Brevibacillus brevis]GEC89236.1 ectoine/hydroxyectoine ABC transporter permease subunit EhuD [Brevibacillus brevis]VEF89196.1 Probable amino-acid permease protein yxeN [Brevibacillus brevis]
MWSWSFTWSILPEILQAIQTTIVVTLAGFVLAMVGGLVLAFGRRSKRRVLSWSSAAFIEFVRSTPLLVQLYFLFYGLPAIGISLGPLTSGVLGLGIHYSCYLSEVYRSGIDAVPRGQWEAARALNFSIGQTWLRIILPQAIRPVVPVLGNYLIVMFKETPILSAITLVEMLATAKIIGAESFRYLEAFTVVGLLFLVLSYGSSLLIKKWEQSWNKQYMQR